MMLEFQSVMQQLHHAHHHPKTDNITIAIEGSEMM
jgi:hypothetical protein